MVHAPSFAHGLGMNVHVRTKGRHDYSFIESIAIQIGNSDILQVSSWGHSFFNGVMDANLNGKHIGPFPITHNVLDNLDHQQQPYQHEFSIHVGAGGEGVSTTNQEEDDDGDDSKDRIIIKTLKDWVSIRFPRALAFDFHDSQGLLGNYTTGERLARDGIHVMEDAIEFGFEWQVRPNIDGNLFQSKKDPQYPNKCILPQERLALREVAQ